MVYVCKKNCTVAGFGMRGVTFSTDMVLVKKGDTFIRDDSHLKIRDNSNRVHLVTKTPKKEGTFSWIEPTKETFDKCFDAVS